MRRIVFAAAVCMITIALAGVLFGAADTRPSTPRRLPATRAASTTSSAPAMWRPQARVVLTIKETPLSAKPIPKLEKTPLSRAVSIDGTKIAFVQTDGQHQWVVVNDERVMPEKAQSAYIYGFTAGGPAYCFRESGAPDSFHLVYEGKVSKGYGGIGIHDNKVSVLFSPDRKHFMAMVSSPPPEKEAPQFMIGFGSPPKEEDAPAKPRPSWNGGHVLVDGKEYPHIDEYHSCLFSADSKHWGYIGRSGDEYFWVIDGVRQKSFADMVEEPARFSENGAGVAYLALAQPKGVIPVVNGEEVGVYDRVYDYALSPDGKHYALSAAKEGKTYVVIDGKEEEQDGDTVFQPVFRYTGDNRLARLVRSATTAHLVIDGLQTKEEYPSYTTELVTGRGHGKVAVRINTTQNRKVGNAWVIDGKQGELHGGKLQGPFFSPTGKDFAYRVHDVYGKFIYVALGRKFPEMAGAIKAAAFSPDESHFVVASEWKETVTVAMDGQVLGNYAFLGPVSFSPDSRHLIYTARANKSDAIRVGTDDVLSKEGYDEIGSGIIPTGQNSFRIVMYRNMQPIRVDVTITEQPLATTGSASG